MIANKKYLMHVKYIESLDKGLRINQNTEFIHQHQAGAHSWVLVNYKGEICAVETYCAQYDGEDILKRFIAQMVALSGGVEEHLKDFEKIAYEKAKVSCGKAGPLDLEKPCGFCEKEMETQNAVRHHKHTPDYEFEFLAHRECNAQARVSKEVHVFLQNMTGYDSKYIIRAAADKSIVEDIEVIGPSSEKFNAIRVNKKLLFLDSYSFFHNSLDAMAKNMDKQKDYKLTRAFLDKYFDDKQIDMLLQKGIYPYEYFTSVLKYNETTLPPQQCFFNQLTQSPISDKDYEWAQTVWNTFNIQNLRQYTELYVTVDALLLADVLKK